MASSPTIAELIHARICAEGGVLHVWLNGSKFRRIVDCRKNVDGSTVDTNVDVADLGSVVSVNDATEVEVMEGMSVFVPSDVLRQMIMRNRVEIGEYLTKKVKSWRIANGIID